jgi:hypothetical protein
MPTFTGQLRTNEIYGALFNMILSQRVFADNIAGTGSELVDKARVDGSLYGDTKLYYSTDALHSKAWGNDAEATNLLQLHRAPAPQTQAIVLDVFRQVSLTLDEYLTKRAWMDEGAFASFTSVMMGWLRDTKRIYDATTYNAFFGNCESTSAGQNINITLSAVDSDASLNSKEKAERKAQLIAQKIADLLVLLKNPSRKFNDYGHIRSYELGRIKVIWNSRYANEIRKVDLPTIFHNAGLVDKFDGADILPEYYFGGGFITISAGDDSTDEGITANTPIYSAVEQEIHDADGNEYEVFAGEETLLDASGILAPVDADVEVYTADPSIICKVVVELPPIMSAFEVGTSFFNPKSLTTNHYLTWGHNTLEYLKNYPMITIKAN